MFIFFSFSGMCPCIYPIFLNGKGGYFLIEGICTTLTHTLILTLPEILQNHFFDEMESEQFMVNSSRGTGFPYKLIWTDGMGALIKHLAISISRNVACYNAARKEFSFSPLFFFSISKFIFPWNKNLTATHKLRKGLS